MGGWVWSIKVIISLSPLSQPVQSNDCRWPAFARQNCRLKTAFYSLHADIQIILLCTHHAYYTSHICSIDEPPKITIHPNSVTDASLGKPVTFTIKAIGTDPLIYQWMWQPTKEGGSEDWQPCSDMEGSDTTTLTIPNVQMSNEGSYHCIVSNHADKQTSKPAQLEVSLFFWMPWRRNTRNIF